MNMCSNNCNYNNVSSCNNPNTSNVGFVIENGNAAVLTNNTNPYNNDVLNANVNLDNFNSNGILNTNNSCSYNGNNSCNCNTNSCGCNCNGNNTNTYVASANDDNVTNGNLQRNLRNFIGRRVTLEFNTNGNCSKKTGVLTCVGCNFVTLRGVNNNNCLLASTDGLNFVTVYNCGC